MAPVIKELAARSNRIQVTCCVTGQHRELLEPILEIFQIRPDYNLDIQKDDQDLFHVTVKVLEGVRNILMTERPDLAIVQGDTTSAFAVALAAFYLKIPVAHVEAGLRSGDRFQPFPEEINRRLISSAADLHFCPTDGAAENLFREQIDRESVHVVGNTVIDALLYAVNVLKQGGEAARYPDKLGLTRGPMILVTGHRRENFAGGLQNIALALLDVVEAESDVSVVFSVHPNPNVRAAVSEILDGRDRIRLIPPPDYLRFVALMNRCFFIITDSGGIQEEAPSLKKPVLVARNVTERPEAAQAGAAVIVGAKRGTIVREALKLLRDPEHYRSMTSTANPFGDGRSAQRIADVIERFFDARNGETQGAACLERAPWGGNRGSDRLGDHE
jgi:UDP-N-acetylglucosamine 2-epimerase (non-hydrolysing)